MSNLDTFRKETKKWLDWSKSKEECYYELKVPAGTYSANNIFSLVWEMITHRLGHWRKGQGWKD